MRTWTTAVRVAVVVVAALAGAAGSGSPATAQAWSWTTAQQQTYQSLPISLTCESFNSWIRCDLYGAEAATEPRTITWYVNGSRFSFWDNMTSVRRTCSLGQGFHVRAVVVGGNGTGEAATAVGCVTGKP